ncbi:hypothetical protein J6590_066785 [Homalodisca vitripennis]|nr:hypothetical protein J6590_066785 [Homalodisca vitripennis]
MRKDGSNLSHVSLEEDESNSVPNSPVKAAEAAAAASALPVAPPTPRSPVYLSHVVSSQVPSSQSHPDEFSYAFGYVTKVKVTTPSKLQEILNSLTYVDVITGAKTETVNSTYFPSRPW